MMYQPYIQMSRNDLLSQMSKMMSSKRLTHCLGVERAAITLAEQYGADKVKAGLAGLLHDYAKEVSDQEFLDLIDYYQLAPELKKWNNNVWHGLVGIYKIREDLGVKDSEILRAIEIHTVGARYMTLLDRIIYVADYIEHNRQFPLVEQARQLAQKDLNQAVAFETANTIAYLTQKSLPIYPQTLETYNAFCGYLASE